MQVSFAQNLVINPSFENFISCPHQPDEVYKCIGWNSFGNSSDYFNACDTLIVDVPANGLGYQAAASGNAYCGLFNYIAFPAYYREYIGSQLIDSLQISTKYFVSFKVSLADYDGGNCWSNKIGVLFSTVPYSNASPPALNNFAHVFSQNIISDTANWTVVKGSFIADSNYKYIIIGNFFDNTNTDTMNCITQGSYFFVDEVCTSVDSVLCGVVNNVEEVFYEQIKIYPNPTKGFFFIEGASPLNFNEIKIFNVLSEEMKFNIKQINITKYEIGLENFSNGMYLLSILNYNNKKCLTKKILIN